MSDTRIWGEGKPGARPCLWPDEEAPFDWDDPAVCRQPAVKAIRYTGAQGSTPVCWHHLDKFREEYPVAGYTVEEVG